MGTSQRKRKIRWWPLPCILGIYLLSLFFIWQGEDAPDRQEQVMTTLGFGILMLIGVAFWLLFFARLANKARLIVLGISVGGLLLLGLTVEIRGVSGDLLPILAFRFSPKVDEQLQADTQTADAATDSAGIPATDRDYPRFLGPDGYGRLSGPQLKVDWTTHPPEELWRVEVGLGWSAFAVFNDYAVTMEQRGDREMVVCYNLNTGEIRWQHGDTMRHIDALGGDGPRATPTIADGRVYSLGAVGLLNCLDLASGRKIWSVDTLAETGAEAPPFGVAASPLLVDEQVLIPVGGPNGKSLVAYDAASGRPLFSGGDDPPGYSTVVPASFHGVYQYLVFNGVALVGHDAGDATPLWRIPWPKGSEHVSQPIVVGPNQVFLSSGYGVGARLFEIQLEQERFAVKELWSSRFMKAKFTNIIYHHGHLFGLDDGILACIDPTNGKRRWKRGRYGHGQIMLVGDVLLVVTEKGKLVLVRATPDKFEELTEFQAVQGKTWNHAALAGDLLLVRNSKEAVCLRLPTE